MDQSSRSDDESHVDTQDSKAMFETVFRRSPDSITITRLSDGLFLEVNDGFERISGYRRDEVIGRSTLDFQIWDEPDEERARFAEELRTKGAIHDYSARFRSKDGSLKHCLVSARTFDNGGEACLIAFTRDITDPRDAQQALRGSEEQYRGIFEATTDGFVLRESDGTIVAVNTAMASMYGYSREEYMNLAITDLMPAEMLPLFEEFRKTVAAGGRFYREAKASHKDGRIFDVEIQGTQLQFRGKPHILTIARDITERKRAESQLLKLNEQLFAERAALDQKNIALREILGHMEAEKAQFKHEICEAVEQLILPSVAKLAESGGSLGPKEIAVLQDALDAILQKDLDAHASNMAKLSPRELDVCDLIKAGYSSKEISGKLNISIPTVNTHRNTVRKKLQLKNKAVNLAAYLRSR